MEQANEREQVNEKPKEYPKEQKDQQPSLKERILQSLDGIRPYLNMEGGDVEFVSFDDNTGIVSVRLQGACSHCAISTVTLKMGIERTLMGDVPEVKGVEQVE